MAATNCLHLPAIGNFTHPTRSFAAVTRSSLTDQSQSPSSVAAKRHLLRLVSDQDRGIKTQSDPQKLSQIVEAIDSLAAVGRGTVTTDRSLSATWRLLWTTEKEQLFIVKNASFFGSMSSRLESGLFPGGFGSGLQGRMIASFSFIYLFFFFFFFIFICI
ncbi:hypothetical protein ACP275_08G094500 [Erythranthe tilingii]